MTARAARHASARRDRGQRRARRAARRGAPGRSPRGGRLRGAVLDVFEQEPLAPDASCGSFAAAATPHVSADRRAASGPGSWLSSSDNWASLRRRDAAAQRRRQAGRILNLASMEKIIKAAVDRGASDLHIKAGDVFRARINGKLVPLTKQALTPEQTKAIALRPDAERGRRKRASTRSPTTTARGASPGSAGFASTSCGSARAS